MTACMNVLNPLGMTGVYLVPWVLSLACMGLAALGLAVRRLAVWHLRRCPRMSPGIEMSGNHCVDNERAGIEIRTKPS